MEYYLLHINYIPQIYFAHGYKTTQYAYHMPKSTTNCEIVFIEAGRLLEQRAEGVFEYPEKGMCILPHYRGLYNYTDAPLHHHFTTAFHLLEEPVPMTAQEVAAWAPRENHYILPNVVYPGKECAALEHCIKQMVTLRSSANPGRFGQQITALFQILTLLTEYSVTAATASRSHAELQNLLYCRRAANYIAKHIAEKISTENIADYVGISYGYLSRIFHSTMSMPIVEYINRAKIQHVRELIAAQNVPLETAKQAVGIEDTKYLSRLFKKYCGMTATEYRELYHAPKKQGNDWVVGSPENILQTRKKNTRLK